MGFFSKVPSISVSALIPSISSSASDKPTPPASERSSSDEDVRSSRSSKRRSLTAIFSAGGRSRSSSPTASLRRARANSSDRMPRTDTLDSDVDDGGRVPEIFPQNAFNQSDSDSSDEEGESASAGDEEGEDDDEGLGSDDPTVKANTEANKSEFTAIDYLQNLDQPVPFLGQAPNLTAPPSEYNPFAHQGLNLHKKTVKHAELVLDVGRPVYQRNRCTITVTHGEWETARRDARRPRCYFVASDLSEESQYAIEWCIGVCMRQGDECLFVTVMETDTKFDPEGKTADKMTKIRNQKERQEKCLVLVREATSLLERTRLNVKITCQVVHAKNARHMIVDMIDFIDPHLVVVGSRGLNSIKGSLMGSVSNYLVQKSAVPVMVARRKLRAPPRVYKKKSKKELERGARVPLDQAAVEKESHTKQATTDENESLLREQEEQQRVIEEKQKRAAMAKAKDARK